MEIKWKRIKPGHYQSSDGQFSIKIEGKDWLLFEKDTQGHVFESKQKRDCQSFAIKRAAKATSDVSPGKKPPPRPGKKVTLEPETLSGAIKSGKGSVPLDSALHSLYLSVGTLTTAIERVASCLKDVVEHPKVKRYK